MRYVPYLIGAALSLALGLTFTVGAPWLLLFAAIGLLAGWLSTRLPKNAERVYWLALLAQVGLIVAAFFGASILGAVMIAPLVFVIVYFACGIAEKFLKTNPI